MQTDLCLKLPRKHLPLFGLCTAVVSATVLLECICMLKRWVGDTVQGKLYLEIALRAGLCFLAETSHSAAVAGGWSPLGWMFHPLFMMGAEQGYGRRGKPAFTAPGKRIALAKRQEEQKEVTQCFTEQRPATNQRTAMATSGLRWEKRQSIFHLVDLPFFPVEYPETKGSFLEPSPPVYSERRRRSGDENCHSFRCPEIVCCSV